MNSRILFAMLSPFFMVNAHAAPDVSTSADSNMLIVSQPLVKFSANLVTDDLDFDCSGDTNVSHQDALSSSFLACAATPIDEKEAFEKMGIDRSDSTHSLESVQEEIEAMKNHTEKKAFSIYAYLQNVQSFITKNISFAIKATRKWVIALCR